MKLAAFLAAAMTMAMTMNMTIPRLTTTAQHWYSGSSNYSIQNENNKCIENISYDYPDENLNIVLQ